MAICGVPEEREGDVQKWVAVKAKAGHSGINELLNLFLDEMSGRFWENPDSDSYLIESIYIWWFSKYIIW